MTDTWTTEDALKGLCELEDVGDPRPIERHELPVASQPAAFVALTKAERRRLTQELADKLLIMAHNDPAAFMDDAGPQINKFLDAASKLDNIEEDTGLPFTKEQIAAMTSDDLKMYIIKSLHECPPERRIRAIHAGQVANALLPFIPAERRDEAMQVLADLPEPSEGV